MFRFVRSGLENDEFLNVQFSDQFTGLCMYVCVCVFMSIIVQRLEVDANNLNYVT